LNILIIETESFEIGLFVKKSPISNDSVLNIY